MVMLVGIDTLQTSLVILNRNVGRIVMLFDIDTLQPSLRYNPVLKEYHINNIGNINSILNLNYIHSNRAGMCCWFIYTLYLSVWVCLAKLLFWLLKEADLLVKFGYSYRSRIMEMNQWKEQTRTQMYLGGYMWVCAVGEGRDVSGG